MQNTGQAVHCSGSKNVIFVFRNNKPSTVERPNVATNFIKDPLPLPSLQINKCSNKPAQTGVDVESARIPRKELFLNGNDADTQTYVLDQSEFASLPLECMENKENVEEIVINESQVHVLNRTSACEEIDSNVCRTCLALAPRNTYKHLFDKKNKDESERFREKIKYIAGDIDFNVSIDPVVCSKCVTIIDIAFGFKRKVSEVEERINKKCVKDNGIKTLVNLRGLIEKEREASAGNVCGENCTTEINDSQKKVTFVNNSHNEVIVIAKNNPCNVLNESHKNLDEYLENRETVLEKFFLKNPVKPKPHVKQTYFANFDIDYDSGAPLLNSGASKSPDKPGEVATSTGATSSKTILGVERLERKFSTIDLFSNIRFRVKRTNQTPGKKWAVFKADDEVRDVTLDVEQKSYGTSYVDINSQGYKYLFKNRRKKKPPVPKTFNLFDEAHDEYFRELEGNVGYHMAHKWAKFGRRPPQMGTGPYLCELCGYTTDEKPKFQSHWHKHRYSLPLKMCSYCGQFYRGSQNLRNHIMCKHKPPSYKCNVCGKMFHLSTNLALHVEALHSVKSKRCQCHECGQLVTKRYLCRHMDNHSSHTYECDVCGKVCNTRFYMYRHRNSHFRRYKCRYCLVDFASDSSMRQHVNQIHEGLRWQCGVCDKLLKRKDRIYRHFRAVHKGQVPKWTRRRIFYDNVGEQAIDLKENVVVEYQKMDI